MKKFTMLLALLVFITVQVVNAQNRKLTGTVTSKEDGSTLPGVSVVAKGTTIGTITDIDGKFALEVPEATKTLIFTFVGMKTIEVQTAGDAPVNVSMEPDVIGVDEVVVTAIGIKRAEKALGYSAVSVSNEELSQSSDNNLMSALQGKVAGVMISGAGSTPGSSTKVVLRGYSSIYGGNNPLYVVDGSPIDNNSKSENGADFGNGANAINPDDIESMTILKGAAATALYGTRAANGVIIINTKSGKANDNKIEVAYSGTSGYTGLLRLPQMQNVYGQGWSGHFAYEENGSWGPKMDGKLRPWGAVVDNQQQIKPFSNLENNIKDFYELGKSYSHSVSVTGGNDKQNFRMSFSNTSEDGIIPDRNDYFERNTFGFNGTLKGDKVSLTASMNYVRRDGKAPADGRGGTNSAANLFSELLQVPRDISLVDHKDYVNNKFNREENYFTVYAYNPYYAIHQNSNKFVEDRAYGNAALTYQLMPELKATWRVGSDITNYRRKDWEAVLKFPSDSWAATGGKKENPGFYSERFGYYREINSDFLLQYDKDLTESLNLNAVVGYNINQRDERDLYSEINALALPGWYNLRNSATPPTSRTQEEKRRMYGLFGSVDMAFKSMVYLTLTARNDWSSTLPKDNNSFFYPSVSTSIILSELVPAIKDYGFAKVRASYGLVGNDADPYKIFAQFEGGSIFNPFGNIEFPVGGTSGYEVENQIGNLELEPEISKEWETGLDIRVLDNRVGLDLAYYKKNTTNQIIPVPIAASSGYTTLTNNIGLIVNKGIEAMITLVPVKTKDLEWEFRMNYTRNRNKVEDLEEGEIRLATAYNTEYMIIEGQPIGVIRGPKPEYYQGKIVVGSDGFPLALPDKQVYGDVNPDYMLGISNTLKYKGLTFGFTFDIRQGGVIYSGTADLNYFVGNATQTLYNDRQPFIIPNSIYKQLEADGTYTYHENVVPVDMANVNSYYYTTKNQIGDMSRVFDRSFVKLREVVLNYSLPKSLFQNMPIKGVEVGLYGKNLLLWTPEENNFIDPEVTSWGNDITGDYGEFRTNPTTRNFGFSVKAIF